MIQCSGLCDYYETYDGFSSSKTYEEYKRCSICVHIVSKEEFPAVRCYCCNGKYRVVSRTNRAERRQKALSNMKYEDNFLIPTVAFQPLCLSR